MSTRKTSGSIPLSFWVSKNHESVRKMAELTVKNCNHALCLEQFVPS